MVVDASAAVAILTGEPGADWLLQVLSQARRPLMPAATYLELSMIIESRLGAPATGLAGRLIRDAGIRLIQTDAEAAERALEGWRRYGKGRHPARLNFGDCLVYGAAAADAIPILCVGDDFARTDAPVRRPPPHEEAGDAADANRAR